MSDSIGPGPIRSLLFGVHMDISLLVRQLSALEYIAILLGSSILYRLKKS